jgi:hypothetical protein
MPLRNPDQTESSTPETRGPQFLRVESLQAGVTGSVRSGHVEIVFAANQSVANLSFACLQQLGSIGVHKLESAVLRIWTAKSCLRIRAMKCVEQF